MDEDTKRIHKPNSIQPDGDVHREEAENILEAYKHQSPSGQAALIRGIISTDSLFWFKIVVGAIIGFIVGVMVGMVFL